MGLYLSQDATITPSDQPLGSRTVSSLAPGVSSLAQTSVWIPWWLAPGSYYVGAIADSTSLIKESNETNNAKTGNMIQIK